MKAKILLFDIESTNLCANFGYILCISYKYFGERKINTIKISDSKCHLTEPTNDKYVVEEIKKIIDDADVTVGWYSSKFDIPFIQSRLLYHNLAPLAPVPHVDGWAIARYKMKLNSNRLATVSDFFGLPDKTKLSGEIWVKASAGDKSSLKHIIKHCEKDVLLLDKVYNKIRSLTTTHPNVNLVDEKDKACPICGSKKLQKRGFSIARTRTKQRYHCKNCGGWSSGRTNATGVYIR